MYVLLDIGPQHSLRSVFYNDLFAFDLERKRWFKLGVKVKADSKPKGKADAKDLTTTKVSNPSYEDSLDMVDNRKVSGDGDGDEEEDNNDDNNNENLFGYIDENGNVTYIEMEAEEEPENTKELKDGVDNAAILNADVAKDEPIQPSSEEVVTGTSQKADIPPHVFLKLEDHKLPAVSPSPVEVEREHILTSQHELSDAIPPPGVTGSTAKGVVVSLGKHFQDLKEPSPRINPALFIR